MTVNPNHQATLSSPLGHINLHIRSGSVILTHTKAEYTLTETRAGGYSLIVSLDERGLAGGEAVLDDGISPDCMSSSLMWMYLMRTQPRRRLSPSQLRKAD